MSVLGKFVSVLLWKCILRWHTAPCLQVLPVQSYFIVYLITARSEVCEITACMKHLVSGPRENGIVGKDKTAKARFVFNFFFLINIFARSIVISFFTEFC